MASSLFSGCTNLKRIQITSPISYVGAHAFANCSNLSEINIPGSASYIGSDCFKGCFMLNKIIFEDAKDPIVFKSTSYSGFNPHFEDCPLTEVYLGRPLKNEDNISPFRYNDKIKILTFNQNVESIGLFYIENWGGQIILNCLKSNPPYVNEFTKDQYMSAIVNIPKGSLNNYKNNSKWSSFWTFNEVYEFKAEDIILNPEKIRLYPNESSQITFTIVPEETTDKTIVWKISDDRIATVSSNGLVTGVSLGKATITATCGEVSATCEVEVLPVLAESIKFNASDISISEKETFQLIATISPENVTDKSIDWVSLDEQIASVSNEGIVTGVSIGETKIIATCGDVSATCVVSLINPIIEVDQIILNVKEAELTVGETLQLKVTVLPEDASDKIIILNSSNENIASVSEEGLITAISPGSATITATCGEVSAECVITVVEDAGVESLLANLDSKISVYSVDGILIKKDCKTEELKSLSKGIYIIVSGKDRYKISI